MIPSAGRIVKYTLTAFDVESASRKRNFTRDHIRGGDPVHPTLHEGNPLRAGDEYPLVMTKVWGSQEGGAVNGQVLLDGDDSIWVASRTEGEGEGRWQPYPRV